MIVRSLVTCLVVTCACLVFTEAQHTVEYHNQLERINVPATRIQLDPSIRVTVNSTVLQQSGEWFLVSWSGVQHPGLGDWLALLVPAGSDPSVTAPAKYKLASLSPTHLLFGRGSLRFRLISYRQDMQFAFMRGGLATPTLVARSPPIRVAAPNAPLQVHLALTGRTGEMVVQWVTTNSSSPLVRWGPAPGTYTTTTPATRRVTYSREQMCGPPATTIGWSDPGVTHVALLTGLVPGGRYYYVVGDETAGFSREFTFSAPPPPGPTTPVSFLAVADLGQAEPDGSLIGEGFTPALATAALLAGEVEAAGLLVHLGDISYARGYSTQWDNYFHQMEPVVASMPYMTTPGNHERDWPGSGDRFPNEYDSGGECGVPYEARLVMPGQGPGQPWYSFDYGPVHFLHYTTEQAFAPGSPQYEFIKADLAGIDRRVTPWVIMGGHRPMYVSSIWWEGPASDQKVAYDLQQALEPLLLAYKVDLTLHGHHHSYQRSCPLADNLCRGRDGTGVAQAPVHLVMGHAGASLNAGYFIKPPIWEVFKLQWGYLRLAANATTLAVEVVSNADASLMDTFTLTQPPGWGSDWMAHQHPRAEEVAAQWYRRQRERTYPTAARQQQVALQAQRRGLQRPLAGWWAGQGWGAGEGQVAVSR